MKRSEVINKINEYFMKHKVLNIAVHEDSVSHDIINILEDLDMLPPHILSDREPESYIKTIYKWEEDL